MKKIIIALLFTTVFICLSGCDWLLPKGEVYVTIDNQGSSLSMVKFLEPDNPESGFPNVYSQYVRTVSHSGYTWYVYEVPEGECDVYVEYIWWSDGSGENGREAVFVQTDMWTAIYPDDGSNLQSEQGSGSFSPGMIYE